MHWILPFITPRQLGGGGGLIEPKYYEGGHCQSVSRSHIFFYMSSTLCVREMAPPFNVVIYHVRGGGIPWHPTRIATRGQLTLEELRLSTF